MSASSAGQEDCLEESGHGQRRWSETHRGLRGASLLVLQGWGGTRLQGGSRRVWGERSGHTGGLMLAEGPAPITPLCECPLFSPGAAVLSWTAALTLGLT